MACKLKRLAKIQNPWNIHWSSPCWVFSNMLYMYKHHVRNYTFDSVRFYSNVHFWAVTLILVTDVGDEILMITLHFKYGPKVLSPTILRWTKSTIQTHNHLFRWKKWPKRTSACICRHVKISSTHLLGPKPPRTLVQSLLNSKVFRITLEREFYHR